MSSKQYLAAIRRLGLTPASQATAAALLSQAGYDREVVMLDKWASQQYSRAVQS